LVAQSMASTANDHAINNAGAAPNCTHAMNHVYTTVDIP